MKVDRRFARCCTVALWFWMILLNLPASGQVKIDSTLMGQHPRLLLTDQRVTAIKRAIGKEAAWANMHKEILAECKVMLAQQPVERIQIGRRLLDKSREALRRIFFLAYAWRITGEKVYFNRCEQELLAISAFTDWNPTHFLDVAEMTMAAAIGYDWLYQDLSKQSRQLISAAIVEKGLNPAQNPRYNGWLKYTNNWNQVCNTGITYGAIAVYENDPPASLALIERAVSSIRIPMAAYAANGNYPEGYGYWAYGTSFNVFFNSEMETLFHTDFGLNELPGFLQTPLFYLHITSPTGQPFNYSDSGSGDALQPAMFWFAAKLNRPDLLYIEKPKLLAGKYNIKGNRFLPAAIIWGCDVNPHNIGLPRETSWFGKGDNPVAFMRSDWGNSPGIFVGLKGGSPSVSHGHMDVGTFVMEAEGVKWAEDLGMQEYESLESKGLNIWDMKQSSQRWQVYRYTNFAHNTLIINGHLQSVKGQAPLVAYNADPKFISAVTDMQSVYQNDLKVAKRGVAIVNKQYVLVRDELETGEQDCNIRWQMLTKGTLVSASNNQATLKYKGKTLKLVVTGLPNVEVKTWSTAPPNGYDAPNPGTGLIGFEIKVPANQKKAFNVMLIPGARKGVIPSTPTKPLSNW